jgi:hypothetical protein
MSDSSISSSLVGEASSPRSQMATNSSRLYAMPPPLPPSVNEGRMTTGKPIAACTCSASSIECASEERALARLMRVMAFLNFSRSSALSIASREAPIISTPNFSRIPSRARSSAQLSAVWPPMVGSSASGRSFSMMRATTCQVTGSM